MRIILSLLVSLGIAFGMYLIVIHSMGKALGGSPATATATVTVQMQLVNLAQAERMHFVQNNSYATIDELRANDEFKAPSPDPNGYVYTVEVSDGGFKATAQHASATGRPDNFPVFIVDQTMHVERADSQGDGATDNANSGAAATDAAKPGEAKPADNANAGPSGAQASQQNQLPDFPAALPDLPAGLVPGTAQTSAPASH